MINRIPPQFWVEVFVFSAIFSCAGLAGLFLYQKGRMHVSRWWGNLRMKWMYRRTEKRRNKGRSGRV